MKAQSQYLSTYQRQQYTIYLQKQLQKLNTFILSQHKTNQKIKSLQQINEHLKNNINQLNLKINTLLFQQKQNYHSWEIQSNISEFHVDFDQRLKKIQNLYFHQPYQQINKQNVVNNNNNNKQIQQIAKYVDELNKNINKKIKNIQKNISHLQTLNQKKPPQQKAIIHYLTDKQTTPTNHSDVPSIYHSKLPNLPNFAIQNPITHNQLKQTQAKLFTLFNKKFTKIQKIIRHSLQSNPITPQLSNHQNKDHQIYPSKQQNYDQYQLRHSLDNQQIYLNQQLSDTSRNLQPIPKNYKKIKNNQNSISHHHHQPKLKNYKKQHKKNINYQLSNIIKNIKEGTKSNQSEKYHSRKSTIKSKSKSKSACKSKSKSKSKSHQKLTSQQKSISRSQTKSIKDYKAVQSISPSRKQLINPLTTTKQYRMNCTKNHS